MEIPIVIHGRETGRLRIWQEGPYRVFEGQCEDPGELLRLSVYGEGREGRLGVMLPQGDGLTILRRLSRAALRDFPDPPEYAGPAGMTPPGKEREEAEEAAGTGEEKAPTECVDGPSAPDPAPQDPAEAPEPSPGDGESPGPDGTEGTELLWYRAGDGSLFTTWQGRVYRAVPMAAHGLPERQILERRRIQGTEYAVFQLPDEEIPAPGQF